MRLGVIDVGSNSVHLLVVDAPRPGRWWAFGGSFIWHGARPRAEGRVMRVRSNIRAGRIALENGCVCCSIHVELEKDGFTLGIAFSPFAAAAYFSKGTRSFSSAPSVVAR